MDFRSNVFQITDSIWLGPFASPERKSALKAAHFTHILNVGEAPSVLSAADDDFREVVWQPIADLERLSDEMAAACLELLHRMVSEADASVYVHCIAGQNRSPTIVWLYLVACGIPEQRAKLIIEKRAPDAIPAHSKLIDDELVAALKRFGAARFLPHSRPSVLVPAN
jgi:protein-tyrosine phosphatase